MQSQQIRLECLKLAHRGDRSPDDVVATAAIYLDWIGEDVPQITEEIQPADNPKEGKKLAPKTVSDKPL